MHPPAVAAQATLLSAFDFVGAQAAAGRHVRGSDVDSTATDAPADPFADLLDGALACVPNFVTDPQPILKADVPVQVDLAGQPPTGGDAVLTESAERANLLAALQYPGRGTMPTARPALTIETQGDARQSSQQPLSNTDKGIDEQDRDAQSLRRVDASNILQTATILTTPAADVEIGESAIASSRQSPQVNSVQAAAGAFGAAPTNAGIGLPDAKWQSASAVNVLDAVGMRSVTAEAPANDAPTPEVDQSYDELRPASDFAQDVQTVPQPETPAGSTPATITIDQPVLALNAAAPAADSADLDDQLRSRSEDASQSVNAADGGPKENSGTQVGPTGRFVSDVYATVSEGAVEPIAPLHAVKPSLDAHSPAVRTKGAGSDGDGTAATSSDSLSAPVADAQVTELASTGSSVVQQISEAVQTWRDALQEQGTARFSAWLTPPDMGHVWVELTRSADGITARLSASDDDVQSLLETQEPELRQALADAGVTVNELDVSGRSTGDSMSQQQQPPPDHREESESPVVKLVPQPHLRRAPTRSSAVDVRA